MNLFAKVMSDKLGLRLRPLFWPLGAIIKQFSLTSAGAPAASTLGQHPKTTRSRYVHVAIWGACLHNFGTRSSFLSFLVIVKSSSESSLNSHSLKHLAVCLQPSCAVTAFSWLLGKNIDLWLGQTKARMTWRTFSSFSMRMMPMIGTQVAA